MLLASANDEIRRKGKVKTVSVNALSAPLLAAHLFVALTAISVAQAGEAYVQAVQAEVAEFTSGSFDLPESSPWLPDAKAAGIHRASAEFEQFNKDFRKKAPGTYIRYNQLPYAIQQQIYRDYVKTGDFNKVRADVLATLGQ